MVEETNPGASGSTSEASTEKPRGIELNMYPLNPDGSWKDGAPPPAIRKSTPKPSGRRLDSTSKSNAGELEKCINMLKRSYAIDSQPKTAIIKIGQRLITLRISHDGLISTRRSVVVDDGGMMAERVNTPRNGDGPVPQLPSTSHNAVASAPPAEPSPPSNEGPRAQPQGSPARRPPVSSHRRPPSPPLASPGRRRAPPPPLQSPRQPPPPPPPSARANIPRSSPLPIPPRVLPAVPARRPNQRHTAGAAAARPANPRNGDAARPHVRRNLAPATAGSPTRRHRTEAAAARPPNPRNEAGTAARRDANQNDSWLFGSFIRTLTSFFTSREPSEGDE